MSYIKKIYYYKKLNYNNHYLDNLVYDKMETLSKSDLVAFCKENKIKGYSKFNKDELIAFLKNQEIDLSNFESREVINKEEIKKESKKNTETEKKNKKTKETKEDSIEELEKIIKNVALKDKIKYIYFRVDVESSNITSLKSKLEINLPEGTSKINGHGQLTSEGMSTTIYIKSQSNDKDKIIEILKNHYLENKDLEIEEEILEEEDEEDHKIITTIYKQENLTLKISEDELFDYFFN